MIKELKYVPVCDKSMKKRKLSKQLNEDWARLGGDKAQASASPGTLHLHQSAFTQGNQPSPSINDAIVASFIQ